MIVLACFLIGALIGAARARARQGTGFDMAQYAVAHGIALALVGLLITVVVSRMVF